jgi:hypothetical protein
VFDRFNLPGFDAYVYLAMAERPGFFTVAPWGYRVLTPWLAHLLPSNPVRAFRQLTLAGLFVAGVVLYLFLRRLGHGEALSLLALAWFGFSATAGEPVRHPFLAEPLCIALFAALLLALESGAGAGRLALALVLGALAKELFILFLPGVFLALLARDGARRALRVTALAALPALLASLLLRTAWVPGSGSERLPDLETLAQALRTVTGAFRSWWRPVLLEGLTPLALLGSLLPAARPYLARYGYFVGFGFALPLAAAVYTGEGEPAQFFTRDVPRLLLYALPVTLPLALLALEHLRPAKAEPAPPRPRARAPEAASFTVACALALLPLLVLDPYRRVDLGGRRSGPYVVGLCRGTLRTASRLEAGQAIVWDPEARSFVPGVDHPGQLDRMRWFLWNGWGSEAYFGTGDFAMEERRASLLVPALRPSDLEATLALVGARETTLELLLNGTLVGSLRVGLERRDELVKLPARLLFRGDNLLTLVARESPAPPGVRLLALRLRTGSGPQVAERAPVCAASRGGAILLALRRPAS